MTNQGVKRQDERVMTGLFGTRDEAERGYKTLRDRGYSDEEINVLMSDETRDKYYASDPEAANSELGTKALEGTGAGAAIGGTLGAIIGGIAAIGTNVLIPGLGLVVAGPIAAALVGAGAGGATGGLVGGLIGWGIPEERAKAYESGISEGGTVIGVNPRSDEDADYFESEWRNHNGREIYR